MSEPKTTAEDFAEDAKWLRELAVWYDKDSPDAERLKRIAGNVEMMSVAMFEPSLQLEQRVEEELAKQVAQTIERLNPKPTEPDTFSIVGNQGVTFQEMQVMVSWLISRQLKSGANKALLGQGLAGLGAGAAAAFFANMGKEKDS